MIAASVDIGTNSVLLLVAEIENGSIRVLAEMESVPRLGKGVDKERNLHIDSQNRVLDVLLKYKQFLNENFQAIAEQTIVTATSAVRDASNRTDFIQRVEKITGWKIRLLSGPEEANTTYTGAISVIEALKHKKNLVFDIGGGSTELALGTGTILEKGVSVDMGSVRFTERFITKYPPGGSVIDEIRMTVNRMLKDIFNPVSEAELIGVAGTVTSIAAIDANLEAYDAAVLNGYRLSKKSIVRFIDSFGSMLPSDIENRYPQFLTGRGEVILAGLLIIDEIMEYFNRQEITVSTGGIRHGILLQTYAG